MVQAILTFMVNQLDQREEQEILMKKFRSQDSDNNGVLSFDEQVEGYMTTLGYMTQEQAIEKVTEIMKTYDTNKSGEIDYSEFIIATLNKDKFLNAKNVKTALSQLIKSTALFFLKILILKKSNLSKKSTPFLESLPIRNTFQKKLYFF